MEKDNSGKRRTQASQYRGSFWVSESPLKASLSVSINYRGKPWQESPNWKTSLWHKALCVWPGAVTGPTATWCTSNIGSLHKATSRNQRDTENSLWRQIPATQSHKRFPWWVSTVRQSMQRLHGSIINSRYAEHGHVWVAYLQPFLSNLLLHWDHCLPTALWGHTWSQIWSHGCSLAGTEGAPG